MFPNWETHNTRDMCFPGGGTHIPSDMCSPTWEAHIPSDMCAPTWETPGADWKHISLVICVPPVKDYFLCLFSKRIDCKSEPEVHFYRNLRYARED